MVLGIVAEIKQLLSVPDAQCFLINSRKKDQYGVEGINEFLKVFLQMIHAPVTISIGNL